MLAKFFSKIVIYFFKLYRYLISPLLPTSCRFYPSCSNYGIESVQRHGLYYGILLTTKRLLKCHPWHSGGYDPVPPSKDIVNKVIKD
jgi:putative membrane protein insertion efficiency factor